MKVPARVQSARIRLAVTAVVLAAIWLAMLLLGRGPLDRGIYEALYAGGRPVLVTTAWIFTAFGEPTVLIGAGFILAAWLWRQKRTRLALVLMSVILLGRGLSEVQKYEI